MKMLQIALSLTLIGGTIKNMDKKVDITNLDRVNILQVLFDYAEPQGNSWLKYNPEQKLSYEQAKEILDSKCNFTNQHDSRIDYLHGRALKVFLCPNNRHPNTLDVEIYNEYNGYWAAQTAIQKLRKK